MSNIVGDYCWLSKSGYYLSVFVGDVSSLLSLFGSFTIIYLVFQRPNVLRDPAKLYHRIILGISVLDVIVTSACLLSLFLTRSDIDLPLAIGNVATCNFVGFLFTFYLGSCVYNCMLSLYYVLTVRFGVSQTTISKRYEPWVHIVAFLVPFPFAIAAVLFESINPTLFNGICTFSAFPMNCHTDASTEVCQRGESTADFIAYSHWVLCAIPTVVAVAGTWLVYWTVRRTKNSGWSIDDNEQQRSRKRQVAMQAM